MAETRGLNDLDSRIAALEKALAQGPSEASDSSEESDSDKAPPSPITPKPKARKRQRPSENLILSESFAPIAPLHETLLPANGITSKIASQPHSSGNSSSSDAPFPERRCDVCPINTLFTTKDAWMRHRRDLLHRQNVVLAAGAVYEPSSGQALYCRVCKVKFGSEAELRDHRRMPAHIRAVEEDKRSSYCQICRKQFTSAHQLKEHCKGKAHGIAVKELKRKWYLRHPKKPRRN